MGDDEMLLPYEGTSFEGLKQVNAHGAEYWSARALQGLLGYTQWRSFAKAIGKAMTSCETSGNDPKYHFARARKPIVGGKGAVQEVEDFALSRFACYLIAQNGDPRKPEIAVAQKYFAVQTRRQEVGDALARDRERLELRKQTKTEFRALSGAAHDAGVQSRMFGAYRAACLACFTTPGTRVCMGASTAHKSKRARRFPRPKTSWTG
jgi:DNA-damage-inducible protein D